ncbi:dapper homolog 2-like [Eublepharis macularius]|uniref:Dapper homolog 2-like n=1 Tax=Eublepharis macularius TaxID=481883 RepID=A0AA97J1S2_EUBMA|nr:dapper homolog 2-like [Eublepharis macularius]
MQPPLSKGQEEVVGPVEPQLGGAMARRAVPPSLWSGNERLRIGERLQASLAGLLELDLLRETQRGSVERALERGQKDGGRQQEDGSLPGSCDLPPANKLDRSKSEDLLGTPKKPCVSYSSSENIEVASRVLSVQARERSDKGCLGLRMVSEQLLFPKKAAVNGGDAQEIMEADSRPSSGFYETSEMGSLSDSCASVHSDGPGDSRCSIGSLSQLPGLRESSFVRPRSTDEAAVRLLDLRLQQFTLANASGTDSRRPVSTGDLEFLLGLGDLSLPLSKNPSLQLLQYKSDLISRNTNEIYHYPSPLHAVALQSPLFTSSLSQSSSQEDLDEGPVEPAGVSSPERAPASSREQQRAQLDRYIAKLVLRYKCRSAVSRTEAGFLAGNQKSLSMSSVCSSLLGAGQLLALAPGWKIRRRISTCSHLRSPEGSEGTRDSQVLDGQGDFAAFPEISSIQSSTTNLSKVSEPSVMSLPDPLPLYREPSLIPCPKKQFAASERGVLDWVDHTQRYMVQVESPTRKVLSLPRATVGLDKLYKGKHASRELVKTTEKPEKPAERSWLSPRELLRRLSLRRKPSARVGSRARASSEINVHAAVGLVCHSDLQAGKSKVVKTKWASVLEISNKASGRHRLKGSTFHPPHPLNRHLAFSADSPASFCFLGGSHLDLPPRQRAGFASSGSGLGEADATSAISLNGDWILHHLGDRWPPGSATLDSTDLPVGNFKLRRSRSFKELKRMMSRSIKGARAPK